MEYASTFTGIGGFEVGFQNAGMSHPTVMVEKDKYCRTILSRRFPHTRILEDITNVSGTQIGSPDLICGGFPCQNIIKTGGRRKGLAGPQSKRYWDFQRLVGEHLRLVDATKARWVVIENTDGLLTSPGRGEDGIDRTGWDMAAVVRSLESLGYGWAYRLVDSRQYGTTQRRRRVLVVGHSGGDPRPAWAVLGDDRASAEIGAASFERPVWKTRPTAVGSDASNRGPVVWRKSSNARASLDKGGYETWVEDGHANTLTGHDYGNAARQKHLIAQNGRLRTLTITEWERLQGFPDGWTEGIPENQRAHALGNAMHVGMAEWLGSRIMAVDEALTPLHR
jgi:DNA (cytosine-5)-methyltransferase 1